jgi:hypothetical protein
MPKDLTKEQVNTGNIIYEWLFQEYEQFERTKTWYLSAVALAIALISYALITANYLFALVIILFGIVLYVHEMQPPLEVYFALTELGIIIGKKFYRFNELSGFWIIYQPPFAKNLYFTLDNVLRHRIRIPLQDFDPRPIRSYISQFVSEELEQEDEPLSDRLARILKIH